MILGYSFVLFDLTYNSREINKKIDAVVGPAYGVFSKVRWQGIGSERLIIKDATGPLHDLFQGSFHRHFANIELRPRGIIIRIRYRLEVYGLVIPLDDLNVSVENNGLELSISSQKIWVVLRNYQGRQLNRPFINKLMDFNSN